MATATGPVDAPTPQDQRPAVFPVGGRNPTALAAGDFDSDGDDDVAVALMNSDGVAVLLADGDGGFAIPKRLRLGSDTISIAGADFDADEDLDLVVGLEHRNVVAVLLGDGRGGFARAADVPTGEGRLRGVPRELATADLDGDGRPDLVALTDQRAFVAFLGDGRGGFTRGGRVQLPMRRYDCIAVGDLTGDGEPDAVTVGFSDGLAHLAPGDGRGGWLKPRTVQTGAEPLRETPGVVSDGSTAVVIDDLDGDGTHDLAVGHGPTPGVQLVAGDGRGGFAQPRRLDPDLHLVRSLTAADLDGDGVPELFAGLEGTRHVAVVGSGLRLRAVPNQIWTSVTADVDGDGSDDLITTDIAAARIGALTDVQRLYGPNAEVPVSVVRTSSPSNMDQAG